MEIAQKLGKKIPEAERRAVPPDFSNRLDDYIYGSPQKLRRIFADTLYWIAIFLPNDPWSETAKSVDLEDARVVTTEEVLSEFLTGVAGFGERTRRLACELVRTILDSEEISVISQSHESFEGGLALLGAASR